MIVLTYGRTLNAESKIAHFRIISICMLLIGSHHYYVYINDNLSKQNIICTFIFDSLVYAWCKLVYVLVYKQKKPLNFCKFRGSLIQLVQLSACRDVVVYHEEVELFFAFLCVECGEEHIADTVIFFQMCKQLYWDISLGVFPFYTLSHFSQKTTQYLLLSLLNPTFAFYPKNCSTEQ